MLEGDSKGSTSGKVRYKGISFTRISFSNVISSIFFLISLQSGQVQALILGQLHLGLVAGSDDEHVREPGRELLACRIPDVDDVEAAPVPNSVRHDPDAADVVPSRDERDVPRFEAVDALDVAGLDVELDRVKNVKARVRVSDGSAVVGDNVRNSVLAHRPLD